MIKKDIVLFGIQGSGKGTMASRILADYPEFFSYEPGELIRTLTKVNGPVGDFFRQSTSGKLLEVSTINALFDMFATLVSPEQSMLLDGFPRNMPNMYHFLAHERKLHRNVMGIYLDLNKNVALQRLLNRYYYKKDGHLYPVLPKDIEQYKEQGYEIVHRDDDNEQAIKTRMDIYQRETMPVIRHFEDEGLLFRVDADQSIDDVYADIKRLIDRD